MSYSNFITPPDIVDDDKHSILLIDVAQDDVLKIAAWCSQSTKEYNVYLYNCEMNDKDWLNYLSLLINDKDLRSSMGMNARKIAIDKYSIYKNGPILEKIIKNVLRIEFIFIGF